MTVTSAERKFINTEIPVADGGNKQYRLPSLLNRTLCIPILVNFIDSRQWWNIWLAMKTQPNRCLRSEGTTVPEFDLRSVMIVLIEYHSTFISFGTWKKKFQVRFEITPIKCRLIKIIVHLPLVERFRNSLKSLVLKVDRTTNNLNYWHTCVISNTKNKRNFFDKFSTFLQFDTLKI